MILANTANNVILGAHGMGTKRLFSMYCGINVNLNKLARVMGTVLGEFHLVEGSNPSAPTHSHEETFSYTPNYATY